MKNEKHDTASRTPGNDDSQPVIRVDGLIMLVVIVCALVGVLVIAATACFL